MKVNKQLYSCKDIIFACLAILALVSCNQSRNQDDWEVSSPKEQQINLSVLFQAEKFSFSEESIKYLLTRLAKKNLIDFKV